MNSVIKKCRVCGKEYEACRSANRGDAVFRWKEVACSPECGAIYLQRINESRSPAPPTKRRKVKKESEAPVFIVSESQQTLTNDTPEEPEIES